MSSAREVYKNNYGQGTMVVSAAYFRLNRKQLHSIPSYTLFLETSETVLVMVRQAKTKASADFTFINCISLKSKRLIKSCYFAGRYNHMEVCIDGRQLDELINMKEGLRGLDNIIVIGGEDSSACLVSLGQIKEESVASVQPENPSKRIALLSEKM